MSDAPFCHRGCKVIPCDDCHKAKYEGSQRALEKALVELREMSEARDRMVKRIEVLEDVVEAACKRVTAMEGRHERKA